MRRLFAAASLVALAGCARLGAADCGPDSYAVGQRDGILGAQPQEEIYAGRCRRGTLPRSWQDGFSRRPRPTA